MANLIHLENEYYVLGFDTDFGTLQQFTDKRGGGEIISEPRLADNFRLLLPLPEVECNYILGQEQPLTFYETTDTSIMLFWQGPLKNWKGEFELDVTLLIKLMGEQIQISCQVHNRTSFTLSEVWYAMIGGMRGLGDNLDQKKGTWSILSLGNSVWNQPLFSDFGNTRGQTLGVLGAEHSACYPGTMTLPWVSLYNPEINRALYVAALEETPRVKAIRFYLEPGSAEGRPGGNWPRPEEVGDLPTGVTMNWTHLPYTKPGETFSSSPIIFQCHDGGWQESAAIYRKWYDSQYPVIEPGTTWMRTETALLHTMFMLPEDNICFPFSKIPEWAKDAKERGVNHLMIAGWNIGGHDRGYPYYQPDPHLGTWEELEAGIKAIHDLGMKVSFFCNCQPIDMTTEWYVKELHKYRILDPYGEQYFIINYWGMGTLGARMRFFTARPFTEMNPAHPEVRELLIRQFKKLIEIGADGIHLDKLFQTPMDFNPRLTWTNPDRAHHEGVLIFFEEMLSACRAINPNFSLSYEGCWDRLFSYTDVHWWGGNDEMMKAVFPQHALTVGVEQPYDYHKTNNAILRGCNLLLGPGNYLRGMEYPPMQRLFAYISEITKIRKELFNLVSTGEIVDSSIGIYRLQVPSLKISGAYSENADIQWTVFRDVKTGRRAIAIANHNAQPLMAEGINLVENPAINCRIYQAFKPVREASLPVSIEVPSDQVVFIAEN